MFQILQILCTILSSFILALAIPNEFLTFGSPLLGLFALFPFYIAQSRSKSLRGIFLLCFLHGSLTHLLSSFWLGNFPGFAIFTLGASDIGTGFFEGFFALAFYFPRLFAKKSEKLSGLSCQNHFALPFRIFWFSGVYTIWEYCKSTGFLAYPWGTISMCAYEWNFLTQIADITGVYGITFLFALVSALLGEGTLLIGSLANSAAAKNTFISYKKTCITVLALFLVSFCYGIYQVARERNPVKTMSTILVQQNRNPHRRIEEENILLAEKLTEEALEGYSESDEKCDLVVWSEAVLSKRFPTAEVYYKFFPSDEPLIKFIKKHRTPFIIGGPVVFNDENHEYGNSALLFDKDGKYSGSYTKMHLVPFAELIPLRKYEKVRSIIKSMVGFSYGWTPGKRPVLFEIALTNPQPDNEPYKIISIAEANGNSNKKKPSAILSTPICFDDSANEVCRALYRLGSEVFVNITNDSWSKTESAEIQHFVVAHYRSIEYRTTTIRSANAGYTCVIDPTGRVLADLPLFQEDALSYKVPIFERRMTVYAIFGDWLPWSLIVLAFAYIFFAVKRKAEEEKALKDIKLTLLPHTIEWYELWDSVMESYESTFSIDWNKWNM